MIDVYKERLAKNDWLTPENARKSHRQTKCHQAYIGYPEELPARYKDKVVDENASLFDKCSSLCACGNQAQLEQVEPAS